MTIIQYVIKDDEGFYYAGCGELSSDINDAEYFSIPEDAGEYIVNELDDSDDLEVCGVVYTKIDGRYERTEVYNEEDVVKYNRFHLIKD